MPPDAIVVGGGPAGSSAALALGRAGIHALILEQQRARHGRVCGAFINPDGVGCLDWLGVIDDLRRQGAVDVPKARLTLADGGEAIVQVTRRGVHGLGVPRDTLEQVLTTAVEREGGDTRFGVRVTGVERSANGWLVSARVPGGDAQSLTASLVVLADGRHSLARLGCPAPFSARVEERSPERAPASSFARVEGWYGWNASFQGVCQRPGDLSMHFYQGGYVGLLTFSSGETNVCGLVRRRGSGGPSWDDVWREAIDRQPWLRRASAGAQRASAWRGVGPLPFGAAPSGRGRPLLAGDAAGVGDPYMGEGISRALGSGRLLHQAAMHLQAATGSVAPEELARRYALVWRRRYMPRLRLGRLVRRFQDAPRLFDPVFGWFLRHPGALYWLSGTFHGEGGRTGGDR